MQLHDQLKICLLAVVNRYSDCAVELSEAFSAWPSLWKEGCSPERMLELLQIYQPDLLKMPALLIIDYQEFASAVYLVNQCGKYPTFRLYCGECFRRKKRKHNLQEGIQRFASIHPQGGPNIVEKTSHGRV
jgi:hypothetical protein